MGFRGKILGFNNYRTDISLGAIIVTRMVLQKRIGSYNQVPLLTMLIRAIIDLLGICWHNLSVIREKWEQFFDAAGAARRIFRDGTSPTGGMLQLSFLQHLLLCPLDKDEADCRVTCVCGNKRIYFKMNCRRLNVFNWNCPSVLGTINNFTTTIVGFVGDVRLSYFSRLLYIHRGAVD